MTSVQKLVWDYIDRRIEIKKMLFDGLVNVSALARKIASDENLHGKADGIISAIRRYAIAPTKEDSHKKIYSLIKKAKISTQTKLVSFLIRRTRDSEKKTGSIYSRFELRHESFFITFEMANHIKIIIDQVFFDDLKKLFLPSEVIETDKNIGSIMIFYNDNISKIPGVFATLANEMALNGISIIDSMICGNEHIIIVREKALEKAFGVVLSLTSL